VFEGTFEGASRPGFARGPTRSWTTTLAEVLRLQGSRIATAFGAPGHGRGDVVRASEPVARQRLQALLDEHSDLAGQSHALSHDPWTLFFGADRATCVPFHERRFSLVAWRDPIGPMALRAQTLDRMRRHAAAVGKHLLIIGASDELAVAARAQGFSTVWIGTEPFFDLARFSTRGKAGEKLRLAQNHVRRLGAYAAELDPRNDPAVRAAMSEVERAWKDARPLRYNRSFLRTAPMENAHLRRYFGVWVPDGGPGGEPRLQAFVVCAPVSRRGFYLQDMVRHPQAPRGASELMAVTAMEALRKDGLEFVTMGIVPFSDPLGTKGQAAVSGPVAEWVVRRFDRLYRFDGLQQFRAKFVPTRAAHMHVCYWPRVLTPMVGWDLLRVFNPTGRAEVGA
jgi:phosphatidylglycerol lysyltransferase